MQFFEKNYNSKQLKSQMANSRPQSVQVYWNQFLAQPQHVHINKIVVLKWDLGAVCSCC